MALFWLSGAFVLGVVAGGTFDSRLAIIFCAGALCAAVAGRRSRFLPLCLVAAALFVGCARSPHSAGRPSEGSLSFYNGRYATVVGQVVEEPDIRDTGANYVVAAQTVAVGNQTAPITGKLELHTSLGQRFEYGDIVQLTGQLQMPVNAPTLPYRDILAGRGINTQMAFPRAADLGPGSMGWLGWIVPFRQYLERGINRALPEPEAALLIAITLGAHSASLGTLAPILVSTGLIHLIAISGIKVALVAGTVWSLLMLLRQRALSLPLSLASLCFYVLLTGATASGERSALMWSLVFIASYLGRGTAAVVSLGFVAALMVAVDPALPWDIGFQLSTVGTLAIVTFSNPFLRAFWYVPSPFREALSVTLAAQLGTVPIVAGGFHSLSVIGPVANALVLPLLPLSIVLGFLVGLLSNAVVLGAPLSATAYVTAHTIIWLSRLLAGGVSALHVSTPTGTVTFAYYSVLGATAWFLLRRVGWAPLGQWSSHVREVTFALLLVASGATVSQASATNSDRLTYLGSGSSFLLESSGSTALIDGSPRPLALLSALGDSLGANERTIDLVIVTDPRSSNVTALLALLDHYQIKDVLDVGAQYPSRTYADWRFALRMRHVPAYGLQTGATARVGRVTVRALGPDSVCPSPPSCAGLLRVSDSHHSFLLATHAGEQEQQDLVFHSALLRASTLLLGDVSHASTDFVRAVHAEAVWCTGKVALPRVICQPLGQGQSHRWPL